MLGAIAGAIGGALSSFASSALSSYLNENSARRMAEGDLARSKELAQWQAQKLPAMQIQGLRDAGINPLLAYSNLGSASVPTVHNTAPQHDYSNVGRALSELPERASALKTAEAQRSLLASQVARNEMDTMESNSRIALNHVRAMDAAGFSARAKKEIAMLEARTDLLKAQRDWGAPWRLGPVSGRGSVLQSAYDFGKEHTDWASRLSEMVIGRPSNGRSVSAPDKAMQRRRVQRKNSASDIARMRDLLWNGGFHE